MNLDETINTHGGWPMKLPRVTLRMKHIISLSVEEIIG